MKKKYLSRSLFGSTKPEPERSSKVSQLDSTLRLEQYLNSKEYPQPKGDRDVAEQNRKQFYELLFPFLISKEQLAVVTGHKDSYRCSANCSGHFSAKEGYNFIDEGRLLLSCGHYSDHIQCILSLMVYHGQTSYSIHCPSFEAGQRLPKRKVFCKLVKSEQSTKNVARQDELPVRSEKTSVASFLKRKVVFN